MEENLPPFNNPPPPPPPQQQPPGPPPVILAPRPQPHKRGRGWMVLALVLLALLAVSLLFNLGHLARGLVKGGKYQRISGPKLEEALLEDHDATAKIAVIEVDGIITGRAMDGGGFGLVDVIKAQLKRAKEDNNVKAVILKVDSPGGEVLASDEIYRAIADFQDKSRKPVVASMGSLAASGGYYISAPCRWIVANEMTITGSIGVIMSTWNYRGLMDKVGLRPETFKSGKFKDMLSGSREPDSITPEERAMVQGLIDETYARFKSVVQEGRNRAFDKNRTTGDKGRRLEEDWQQYADGRVLSGTQALKLGFIDQLGGFDDAVEQTKKFAGISRANLIQYQQRYDLADLFRLFGKSDAKAIKVDLGIDAPRLQAGQLYFLSPTYLH
jgi:protease-4